MNIVLFYIIYTLKKKKKKLGFQCGSDGKESTCNVEDLGLIPGLARSLEGGHGKPPQYSCLENTHGQRSLVGYILQGVAKSWT